MSISSAPPEGRAEAKSAILDVIHRYAYLAKEQADFEAMVPLWVDGGTFTLPNGMVVPCTEVKTIVATGEPTFIRHHVTTVDVEFTGEGAASTDTYFIAYTDVAQPDHWGRWEDTFVRTDDGQWRLQNKSVVIEGFAEVSFWAELMAKLAG